MERSTYASGGDGSDTGGSFTNGSRQLYSNGRASGRLSAQSQMNTNGRGHYSNDLLDVRYNGSRYNEPENNKSTCVRYSLESTLVHHHVRLFS
jgi:hypothetical protein